MEKFNISNFAAAANMSAVVRERRFGQVTRITMLQSGRFPEEITQVQNFICIDGGGHSLLIPLVFINDEYESEDFPKGVIRSVISQVQVRRGEDDQIDLETDQNRSLEIAGWIQEIESKVVGEVTHESGENPNDPQEELSTAQSKVVTTITIGGGKATESKIILTEELSYTVLGRHEDHAPREVVHDSGLMFFIVTMKEVMVKQAIMDTIDINSLRKIAPDPELIGRCISDILKCR